MVRLGASRENKSEHALVVKWQTRRLQVPVPERAWRFDSSLTHAVVAEWQTRQLEVLVSLGTWKFDSSQLHHARVVGIGRHGRLKIGCRRRRAGSTPALRTRNDTPADPVGLQSADSGDYYVQHEFTTGQAGHRDGKYRHRHRFLRAVRRRGHRLGRNSSSATQPLGLRPGAFRILELQLDNSTVDRPGRCQPPHLEPWPRGLWRTPGKRVGVTPSQVRILLVPRGRPVSLPKGVQVGQPMVS